MLTVATTLTNLTGVVWTEAALAAAHAAHAARPDADVLVELTGMKGEVFTALIDSAGVATKASAAARQSATITSSIRKGIDPMAIIRDRKKLHDASDEDLRDTYRAMTGDNEAEFEDRAIAYNKASMAVLSAEYEAGQLGVPKDAHGAVVAMTHEERMAKVRARTAHFGNVRSDAPHNANSHQHQQEHIMATKKATPKAKASEEAVGRGPTPKEFNVKATGAGTTKVRGESARGQILAYIAEHKKISVSALDEHFGKRTLGEVRVLIKLGHVEEVA